MNCDGSGYVEVAEEAGVDEYGDRVVVGRQVECEGCPECDPTGELVVIRRYGGFTAYEEMVNKTDEAMAKVMLSKGLLS